MLLRKFILVPGILELHTNVMKIPLFFFGTDFTSTIKQNDEKSMFSSKFIVLRKVSDISSITQSARYRDVTICEKPTKQLFFEKALFPLVKIKLTFEEELMPVISCNYAYYRLFKFPVGGIPTPGETLSSLIGLYMIENYFLPLRASAFSYKQASTILFGIKGSGKTTFIFDSIINHGCKIVGEDTVILDHHGNVYGSTYLSSKLENTRKALRDLGVNIKNSDPKNLYELINSSGASVEEKAKLNTIIFLKRSSRINTIKEIDVDTAVQYVMILNRGAFSYEQIPIIQALLYSDDRYRNFRKMENEILRKALKDVTCLIIESQSPQKASELFFNSSYFKNV